MKTRNERLAVARFGDPEKGTQFLGMNDTLTPEKLRPGEATLIENFRVNVQSTGVTASVQKANLCKRGGTTLKGVVDYISSPPTSGDWKLEYEADALPSAAADAWTKSGTFTIDEAVATGVLTLTATSGEEGTYCRSSLSTLDNSVGTTVKLDVQLSGAGAGCLLVKIEDGTMEAEFKIYKDKIVQNSFEYAMNTTEDSHVYYLTLKEGQFRAYVNDIARIVNAPSGTSANKQITFGIESAPIVALIDYVKYEDDYLYISDWVRSAFHYTTVTGFDELIVHTGEMLMHSYDNGVTWSHLYGRLNSNYRVHAVQYLDKLYITNGYNSLLWYDGHTVTRADDETHHDNFPKAKYLGIDENADILAVAHLNDAPNGIRFMSIIDADGETVTPDDNDAWLYATVVELEREGGITGIIHFNNCWVITQRYYLTVMTGHSPENFRKFDLRFQSGEGTGCISQETLQIKQGYLYGAGAKKIWRWRGPGSPLEDLSGDRIQDLYDTLAKPEMKYCITTTQAQFENCTQVNADLTTTAGDVTPINADTFYASVASSNFTNPLYVKDHVLDTLYANSTGTPCYVRLRAGSAFAGGRYSSIRVKYVVVTGSTIQVQYRNSSYVWTDVTNQSPAKDAVTFDSWDTTTFTFDEVGVDDYGIRLYCTNPGNNGDVKIGEMWFKTATIIGKEQHIGSPDELGVFEADACTGTSGVPSVSYYVRYATTKSGLSGSWTQAWVGQRLPDNGSNTWMQWKAVLDIGDETDGSFAWYYPALHFVKLTWIDGGLWKNKPTAVVYDNQYFLSMSLSAGSYNAVIMVYDTNDLWTKDIGKYRSCFVVAGGILYGGDANSLNFYKDEDFSVGSDNGSAIFCKWYSRYETFGTPELQKNLRRYRVWFGSLQQNGAALAMHIDKWYDGSSVAGVSIGTIAKNVATDQVFYYKDMLPLGLLGEKFRFQLSNNSSHRGVEIGMLQIEAKLRSLR